MNVHFDWSAGTVTVQFEKLAGIIALICWSTCVNVTHFIRFKWFHLFCVRVNGIQVFLVFGRLTFHARKKHNLKKPKAMKFRALSVQLNALSPSSSLYCRQNANADTHTHQERARAKERKQSKEEKNSLKLMHVIKASKQYIHSKCAQNMTLHIIILIFLWIYDRSDCNGHSTKLSRTRWKSKKQKTK